MSEHELWRSAPMRKALAERDIGKVYKLLQRYGVTQRRIAAYTGQSQSEISEILAGRRVTSYDVLVRIAEGLMVPRGHMGLAFDEETVVLAGPRDYVDVGVIAERVVSAPIVPAPPREVDDRGHRRRTVLGDTGIRFYFRAPLPPAGDDEVSSARAVRPVAQRAYR